MAYIAPNSTIKLLVDVPLDPNYSDTLWFSSASAQLTYFNSKVRTSFTAQSYQRHGNNKCRLNVSADLVDDCNYMMFQNTAFSTKWFFAFITAVEYINTNVAEITFEIDHIQTWFFDYTVPPCYVERMHAATDAIGDNIVPENANTGEYVFNGPEDNLHNFNNCCIALMYAQANAPTPGVVTDGIFGGCLIKLFHLDENDPSGRAALMSFIAQNATEVAAMVGIYLLPLDLLPNLTFNEGAILPDTWTATVLHATGTALTASATLDGYTPKNKKLYTYPYNFYHVDNCQGGSLDLRYEFFDNLQPYFEIRGNISYPIGIMLFPYAYKVPANKINVSETLTLGNFPMCSFSLDSFVAWLSQNMVPSTIKMFGGAAASLVNKQSSGQIAGSIINQAADLIADGYSASVAADILRGNMYNGNTAFASHIMGFLGIRASVNYEYAKMIDDYFTAYGYAQHKIMAPNRHVRSRFTYVKTVGCVVKASDPTNSGVPSEALRTIESCYNNGIRFWADTVNTGNMSDSYPNNLLT